MFSFTAQGQEDMVPYWIKDTANFWINDEISDIEFLHAMKYLIENEILIIDTKNSIIDKGEFYITYLDNPNSPFGNSSRDWLISTEYLEIQQDFLNELFSLPYDIEILVMECADANMFYDWELKQTILYYEFIDQVYYDFNTYDENNLDLDLTEDDISIMTYDVTDFFFSMRLDMH